MESSTVAKDLIIIGGGPAALTAALYATRAGLDVQVYERKSIGGLLGEISQIDNYPGFAGAGSDLAAVMRRQAEAAGVRIDYGECTAVRPLTDGHATSEAAMAGEAGAHTGVASNGVTSNARVPEATPGKMAGQAGFELVVDGVAVRAGAVLVATGAEPTPLPFAVTPPVSYCALCDGALAADLDVVVVGGANAAVQESLYLANLAKSVTLITHSKLKADEILQKKLAQVPNVKVIEDQEPTAEFLNQFSYVFVFIGRTPATKFLQGLPILDSEGYILTGGELNFSHMTSTPGLFAAGDVRATSVRQVVTAAGDGASAAIEISAWLDEK